MARSTPRARDGMKEARRRILNGCEHAIGLAQEAIVFDIYDLAPRDTDHMRTDAVKAEKPKVNRTTGAGRGVVSVDTTRPGDRRPDAPRDFSYAEIQERATFFEHPRGGEGHFAAKALDRNAAWFASAVAAAIREELSR